MVKRLILALGLLILILAGCQQAPKTTAAVKGQLLVKDPDFAMPASDNAIYLVPLASDQTVMSVPTISFDTAIQADVDESNGKFVFAKVTPGKYLVMVLLNNSNQMPASTQDGSLAVVDVKDTDLGKTIKLDYLTLP